MPKTWGALKNDFKSKKQKAKPRNLNEVTVRDWNNLSFVYINKKTYLKIKTLDVEKKVSLFVDEKGNCIVIKILDLDSPEKETINNQIESSCKAWNDLGYESQVCKSREFTRFLTMPYIKDFDYDNINENTIVRPMNISVDQVPDDFKIDSNKKKKTKFSSKALLIVGTIVGMGLIMGGLGVSLMFGGTTGTFVLSRALDLSTISGGWSWLLNISLFSVAGVIAASVMVYIASSFEFFKRFGCSSESSDINKCYKFKKLNQLENVITKKALGITSAEIHEKNDPKKAVAGRKKLIIFSENDNFDALSQNDKIIVMQNTFNNLFDENFSDINYQNVVITKDRIYMAYNNTHLAYLIVTDQDGKIERFQKIGIEQANNVNSVLIESIETPKLQNGQKAHLIVANEQLMDSLDGCDEGEKEDCLREHISKNNSTWNASSIVDITQGSNDVSILVAEIRPDLPERVVGIFEKVNSVDSLKYFFENFTSEFKKQVAELLPRNPSPVFGSPIGGKRNYEEKSQTTSLDDRGLGCQIY